MIILEAVNMHQPQGQQKMAHRPAHTLSNGGHTLNLPSNQLLIHPHLRPPGIDRESLLVEI